MEMLLVYWTVTYGAHHHTVYNAKVTYRECHRMIATIAQTNVQVLGYRDPDTGMCFITVYPERP